MTRVWGDELNYTPDYWSQWLIIAAIVIAGMIAVMLIHMALRKSQKNHGREEKIYLYTLPVRLWHWINAVLFIGLLISGVMNHFDIGPTTALVAIHKYFGYAFVFAWASFIVINILCGNIKHYFAKWQNFTQAMFTQAHYYAIGSLKGEPHPFTSNQDCKFNPLQQVTYVGVVYVLMPLLIITGLVSALPGIFGKHPAMLTAHFVVAVLGLAFLLGHLYLSTGGAYLTQYIKGMLDGYSRHNKEE